MAASGSRDLVEEAQKRSQDVLNLLPDDVEALNVLAASELRLGKPDTAEAHLEQALRKSPTDLRSSVSLAQTKLVRKDVAGAEEALKQAEAKAPKSPEARLYLGGFYLAFGRTSEAEQQFRAALQIDPKNGPALLALAGTQARAGQTAQADQTYRQVSLLPDKQYKPVHALYLFETEKRVEAVAEFEKLAKADSEDRNVRTYLVRAYLALNRVGDAEAVLTAALKKNKLDVDALIQRSRIYLMSQKYAQAQTDLNQILHYRNDSAEAHYLLSKVQQGKGDSAVQQAELNQTLKLDPTYLDARIDLARLLIANHGANLALQLLDQAPDNQKNAVRVLAQRNWALLALGQTADAGKGVKALLASGKVPDALLQNAILKLDQKDYAGARASLAPVLSQNPNDTRALGLLFQSYSAQNQAAAGVQKVREEGARHPGSAAVQEFLGQLLMSTGDRVGARKAFEAAKAANPDLVAADLALVELDTSDGKRDDARKRLSAVVAAHPENLAGQVLWAQLDMVDGDNASAITRYRKALELDDKNAGVLNNLAYLLADSKHAEEALKYAQEAKELDPENPAMDDTLGWTYYQQGMYPMAVTYLDSAIRRQDTARREYHLAMAHLKAGDRTRAGKALETALKMDPKLPEAQVAKEMLGVAK